MDNSFEAVRSGVHFHINPFSAKPTKWPNALKQFVGELPTYFFSVFDHFVGSAIQGKG